jgi:hypothetical protein
MVAGCFDRDLANIDEIKLDLVENCSSNQKMID